jgi:hypothetical protein
VTRRATSFILRRCPTEEGNEQNLLMLDCNTLVSRQRREIAILREEVGEGAMLLEAIFSSRSWRLGFAITRLWRKLVPSSEPTAEERWSRMRRG